MLEAQKTAILICDMWETFCWEPAIEHIERIAPKINNLIFMARNAGSLIVHAPSGCIKEYEKDEARRRAKIANNVNDFVPKKWYQPEEVHPFPTSIYHPWTPEFIKLRNWKKQHPSICIDQSKDIISCSGKEIYNVYKQKDIQKVFITGIHLNGCVLSRDFGVRALVEVWRIDVSVVWDLTSVLTIGDHSKDLKTMIHYIEKFWCTTINSADLIEAYNGLFF